MHLILNLINGETIEQTISANNCIIGRSSKCDIVIPHEGMSRQHCQIEFINGQIFVTDLDSTNGVMIDGKRIEKSIKVPYQTFLTLSFGAVQSLQIEFDHTKASIALPESLNKTSITRTKTKVTNTQSVFPSIQARREKEEKMKFWAINFLGLAILGLAVYWYLDT